MTSIAVAQRCILQRPAIYWLTRLNKQSGSGEIKDR